MKRSILIFCTLLLVIATNAQAEVKMQMGSSYRLRHEFVKDVYDLNNDILDNRNYFRIRSSVWADAGLSDSVNVYLKLTNEFRAYTYYAPSSSKTSGKNDKAFHFDINEVAFDNFYLNFKNAADLPVDIRLGRQDLKDYGEEFLVSDGTPGDKLIQTLVPQGL